MNKERMLAEKHGYPSPINDTYDDTTSTYYKSLDVMLEEIAKSRNKFKTIVASHNEKTVVHAVNRYVSIQTTQSITGLVKPSKKVRINILLCIFANCILNYSYRGFSALCKTVF